MPTYLCHGFRWARRSVRVYIILHDLDDASPEWIIPPASSQCILESFYTLFDFLPSCSPPGGDAAQGTTSDDGEGGNGGVGGGGGGGGGDGGRRQQGDAVDARDVREPQGRGESRSRTRSQSRSRSRFRSRNRNHSLPRGEQEPLPLPGAAPSSLAHAVTSAPAGDVIRAQDWSAVKLLEEYDPTDLTDVSRPYVYVADHVVRVDLSASVADEIRKYEQKVQANRDHPPVVGPLGIDTGGGGGGGGGKKKTKKSAQEAGWFEKLRDQLQEGEELKWYVVVNNDE
ncbi:hypothetical protein VTK73DRAFT_4069 [Phialemonium thermophilum]|uniref:Uncharacterized protein n=1 Tax=Phialemonium thermophilum TaxID=223376 RepID=A0ABR3VCT8_9PEZI